MLKLIPGVENDPRVIAHGRLYVAGRPQAAEDRRDLDNHMLVTFYSIEVDLDIDSDNSGMLDGNFAEDIREAVVGAGGKFVPANTGDQDGDGIPNYADGYDLFPGQNTANGSAKFTPMVIRFPDQLDLAATQFRLVYSESDPKDVTRSGTPPCQYSLPHTGAYRIWTKDGDAARKMAPIDAGGDFIKSNTNYPIKLLLDDAVSAGTNRSVTVYLESVEPGITASAREVVVEIVPNVGSQSSLGTLTDTVSVCSAMATLAVDADRDGYIRLAAENNSDATSKEKPYRFWINDDIDRSHTVDGNDTEEDDLFTSPDGKRDWEENQIQSKRDLEDFARLKIYLGGLQDAVTQGTIKVGLKWKPAPESTGSPSLKVWRNLSPNGGTEYLTDETVAQQHLNLSSPGLVQGTTPYLIPTQYWTDVGLSASQPYGNLLFEGCTAGKGQLVITLHNSDGAEIGEGSGVWIELKSIEEFYERWTAGDGNGGDPATAATRKKFVSRSGNTVSYDTGFEYPANAPEENKYILYVHGWNMAPEEKNRFAETAFKRLYWQGYKGRFGVFCWPTTYNFGALVTDNTVLKNKLNSGYSAATDPTNYDRGEWTAWKSSFPLMQLLTNLRSAYPSVNVVAHSMGNIVTGEALRRLAHVGTTNVVDCYVASQAALPAHSYDGTVASDLLADVPLATLVAYADGGHPETPNIYPTWLAENGGAAGRRVNFYNVNDFALWHDSWEANQFLKPDGLDDPDQPWIYKYTGEVNTVQDLFKRTTLVWTENLHLGDATIPQNRWEIMAFAAEARSRAVGAKDSTLGMNEKVDLQTIWPDDTGLRGSSNQKWGAHKWHSAQFRSTNMRQGNYWKTLLGPLGFNLPTTP